MKVMLPLTKETILMSITSYDIFKHYCSNFSKVGNYLFKSELRQDNNPTCAIKQIGNDLKYRDFTEPDLYNCFEYVMRKYGVNYYQALDIINKDFNLGLIPNSNYQTNTIAKTYGNQKFTNEFCKIKVKLRKFDNRDKEYWKDKYGITSSTLLKNKVYALESFTLKGNYYSCHNILTYGYYYGVDENNNELWAIYRPYCKDLKWIKNIPYKLIDNHDLKGTDILFITKSKKDKMVLNQLGYDAINPQSETSYSYIDIQHYKDIYKHIYLLFDNDEAGKTNSSKASELFNLKEIFIPDEYNAKDCSDFVDLYSYNELSNVLKNELSSYNT